MIQVSTKARGRIEAQGFLGLTDKEVCHLNYWFRLAPAIFMVWTALGVAVASPVILYLLVPFAVLGSLMRVHPFDAVYEHVVRFYWLLAPPMPAYGAPRRFGCVLASVALFAAGAAFQFGAPGLGYAVGGMLVAIAFINVATGFCVPSFIYGLLFGRVETSARTNA